MVRDGSPAIGDDTIGIKPATPANAAFFGTIGDLEDDPVQKGGGSLEDFTDDALDEMGEDE